MIYFKIDIWGKNDECLSCVGLFVMRGLEESYINNIW